MNLKDGILTVGKHDLKPYDTLNKVKTALSDKLEKYQGFHGCYGYDFSNDYYIFKLSDSIILEDEEFHIQLLFDKEDELLKVFSLSTQDYPNPTKYSEVLSKVLEAEIKEEHSEMFFGLKTYNNGKIKAECKYFAKDLNGFLHIEINYPLK
ncbi:hypothetical protein [Metabacillus rhizolycopersici]|uniref:DUF5085 family protein n=1 Tax=Metabacillus rhizolycopersici TaxID=2875709 RepID=A0ABS7UY58_9BACI|nr:hypothetical protein [Metabacillus rhizolycopersici]MBZ5753245.1 hypothetical protein [Metabacillus rhizolycopersici]